MFDNNLPELRENAIEALATRSEKWMGDTGNDILARAVIGSLRPMVDALSDERTTEASALLQGLIIRHMANCVQALTVLDQIAAIRDEQ
jgi:hypothetical protein